MRHCEAQSGDRTLPHCLEWEAFLGGLGPFPAAARTGGRVLLLLRTGLRGHLQYHRVLLMNSCNTRNCQKGPRDGWHRPGTWPDQPEEI